MAERNPPAYLQGGSHPADLDRLALSSFIASAGVSDLVAGQLAVVQQGTPGMGVTVAAGYVWVAGDEAVDQGFYGCQNDAAVDLAVAASDPTNPRIDLVVAQVEDSFYSGATDAWSLAVVTGTPAATPAEPTVPDNALVLARVDVAATDASITDSEITDRRVQAHLNQAMRDDGPRGELAYAQITANETGFTAEADITGLTVTLDPGAGRKIKITVSAMVIINTSGDRYICYLTDASNTALQRVDDNVGTGRRRFQASLVHDPGAGSRTYKARLARVSGTGTVTVEAAADFPSFILVEDIGPA